MKALHCLGLAGSPRRRGNTSHAVERVLQGCADAGATTEKINLCDLTLRPCIACDACLVTGNCVLDDDWKILRDQLIGADRIILAAPIYGMGINAQTKILIDRCQPFWAIKYVQHNTVIKDSDRPLRKGMYIGAAGTNLPNVFEGAVQTAKYFFHVLEVQYGGMLGYRKLEAAGAIVDQADAMQELYQAGMELGK